MKTNKFIPNRISIPLALAALSFFPFISMAQIYVPLSDNVGIGTTTPASKLDVEGNVSIGATYSGTTAAPANGAIIEGNVGLGTTTPMNRLDVEGEVAIGAAYSGHSNAPTNGAIIEGTVGIGTSTPAYKLEVNGTPTATFTNNPISLAIADNAIAYSSKGGTGLSFKGLYKDLTTLTEFGYIGAVKENTTQNNYSGKLMLGARTNGSSIAEITKMTILGSNGYVGIGITNPGYKLDVQNGGSSTVNINTNGTVQASAGVLTSDQMFKTNIDSLQSALTTIRQLKPKSYYFDTLNFNGAGKFNFQSVKQYGFIANDIEIILPELVTHSIKPAIVDSVGNVTNPAYPYRALNYNAFIPILTKGIQELQFKNDSLQSKVNNQDSINTSLQNQLNQLLAKINNCCTLNETRVTPPSTNTPSQTSIKQTDVVLNDAQSVVLQQNVPNPFAEQTSINYSLPDNTLKAQMLFYNAQGKLIQSTELTQKGKGTLNVFASDLSSGIYTYTLVVDGVIIESKKMVKQ